MITVVDCSSWFLMYSYVWYLIHVRKCNCYICISYEVFYHRTIITNLFRFAWEALSVHGGVHRSLIIAHAVLVSTVLRISSIQCSVQRVLCCAVGEGLGPSGEYRGAVRHDAVSDLQTQQASDWRHSVPRPGAALCLRSLLLSLSSLHRLISSRIYLLARACALAPEVSEVCTLHSRELKH